MADLHQLDFELPGFIEITPDPPKPAARGAAPPEPKAEQPKISHGRGLRYDAKMTKQCREWVISLGLPELAKRVKVYWNTRLVTTAGLAHHGPARIDLNPRLARFAPEEPDRTLRHELAHLVANHRAGSRRIQPHGREWRRACVDLGIPNEQRCHNLPLARRAVKRKFAYRCCHCGVVVPRVRKLSRESACYPCCREHNRGRYSRKYMLESISLDYAREIAPEHAWA